MTNDNRTFEARLDKLAEVAVRVGLGAVKGQEVVMTAPLDAVPLARRITHHAYKAGATIVTILYTDDATTLERFATASDESFDKATAWLYDGMAAAFRSGAARLAIVGENPSLLAGQDPAKVARANRARSAAYRPALDLIARSAINWTIVSAATPAWARTVFPDLPEAEAVARLWDAIFAASRVDAADPIEGWAEHNRALAVRTGILNEKRYAALRFTGPGTDLEVGLCDGHRWAGGAGKAENGITYNANIPTEEVFTTPHRARVNGHVAATKPLSYQGTLIQDIRVRFEGGAIVEAHASSGEDVLRKVLEIDEGSCRLGEVALVPHASPISLSGLLFYNTLYDENAASHIALGQAYAKTVEGGGEMTPEQQIAAGINASLIHIDWMIGSGEVDVDGVRQDGSVEPVMRKGAWV
ncbi:peptidase M29 [Prosthecomicrobium hirschii]|uniref:Peptidase M29 n=1 Tax=Prosthecodimorpha hirschii TaxID=665126 RepID=A0A0P6W2P0_9HYPH|nr:aminopeptidase [Prosthecomicrobium hirschii]KPL52539.1 peptidase M29 [Prosthecomicrobium hirschii]TPQ52321.1 aminopeptidase [Prosthecomicrobium hirschii]